MMTDQDRALFQPLSAKVGPKALSIGKARALRSRGPRGRDAAIGETLDRQDRPWAGEAEMIILKTGITNQQLGALVKLNLELAVLARALRPPRPPRKPKAE